MAQEHNIPVIVLVREDIKGSNKSLMVLGLPNLHAVIKYSDINDLSQKLDTELAKVVFS